jgi:hypothetical protein
LIMNKVYFLEDLLFDLPAENFKVLRSQFGTSSLDGNRKQANEEVPGGQFLGKTVPDNKTST